jgi:hypothetical protein
MKSLFFLILLMPILGFSQSCDSLFKKETNEETNEFFFKTELYESKKDGKEIYWRAEIGDIEDRTNVIAIRFITTFGKSHLISSLSSVVLTLRDNSTLSLINLEDTNNRGIAGVYFYTSGEGSAKDIEVARKIAMVGVKAVELLITFQKVSFNLTRESSDTMQRVLDCALEAKNWAK